VRAVQRLCAAAENKRRVFATVRALASADSLPGTLDVEATIPPTGRAFVRRVSDRNLWLWYHASDDHVFVIALTAAPPIPIDEG
jgi:hypothetical protein